MGTSREPGVPWQGWTSLCYWRCAAQPKVLPSPKKHQVRSFSAEEENKGQMCYSWCPAHNPHSIRYYYWTLNIWSSSHCSLSNVTVQKMAAIFIKLQFCYVSCASFIVGKHCNMAIKFHFTGIAVLIQIHSPFFSHTLLPSILPPAFPSTSPSFLPSLLSSFLLFLLSSFFTVLLSFLPSLYPFFPPSLPFFLSTYFPFNLIPSIPSWMQDSAAV